jgi:Ca2+-binding EF-hand superfamily protein
MFLGGLILLLEATQGYAQRGPGGGGKFKFGQGGGKQDPPSPDRIFGWLSKGRDHFLVSEAFRDRDVLELFAKQNNISDGKINLQQFTKYWEQRDKLREEAQKAGGGKGGPGGGPGGRGGDPEAMFKRFDTNGDGFLNEDEINQTRRFKEEWKKWDANKDGKISLDEWKAYWEARVQNRDDRKDGDKKDEKKDGDKKDEKKESITRIELDEVENVRPVVYYGTNLPKELPTWFTELDTNKDGQVSLMEWIKGNKPLSEFAKYDRNDDGLITPEEVLRELGLMAKVAGAETVADAGTTGPDAKGGGFGKGNFPGFGKGFPGFGKGQFGKGQFGRGFGKGGGKGRKGRFPQPGQ